ncbi:MtnX-like HAD-IB family phosphatase [Aureimonas sp. AU20]|uniref:MtnX-like HAD-IB family phosphatase n=1 Tax=Aureimonas sp. AU20 TaxID=1349819 RepID=UPI0007218136|nr:MtnX-like HAD-IB family phosphatase [Aureimonas sp. AU20]ALN74971.1 hypothetical protein M673_19785 [Aureimonas sp. AU20]
MGFDILCDFDGTISRSDVTDLLLERLAVPGWEAVEASWERGEIGSRECMARQVALIDASAEELDAVLEEVEIDPGFPAFLGAALKLGARVSVVSDGIDYAIRRVLARHGVRGLPVLANRLVATGERSYRLEHPHAEAGCASGAGTCKCAVAGHQATSRRILIGDGRSDFCGSGAVELVLAKGALASHCEDLGRRHVAFTSFDELTAQLAQIVDLLPPLERRATEAA